MFSKFFYFPSTVSVMLFYIFWTTIKLVLKLNCFKLYIDVKHVVQIHYTTKFILKREFNADFGLLHKITVM